MIGCRYFAREGGRLTIDPVPALRPGTHVAPTTSPYPREAAKPEMPDAVRILRRGKVLEITLDRPPANAINRATSYALYDAFATLRDDTELLVGIITGAGERIFSAGWDLKEVAGGDEPSRGGEIDLGPGGLGGLTELWDLHKPVVAAVDGHAVGGGFELAMAADVMVAGEHAEFFLPEMQRGFLPDAGGVQADRPPHPLQRRHGPDADRTPHGRCRGQAMGLGAGCRAAGAGAGAGARGRGRDRAGCSPCPAGAQGGHGHDHAAAVARGFRQDAGRLGRRRAACLLYERMMRSEDFAEGARAFAEKRPPVWKGR